MIEPFAPLYPWLRAAVEPHALCVLAPSGSSTISYFLEDGDTIDLRNGPTRYAVLRALADAGHARPWALGAPWSPLTDEQAGRAAAAILRAVGEDPSKPVGVVPVCVLEAWHPIDLDGETFWCRDAVMSDHYAVVSDRGWSIHLRGGVTELSGGLKTAAEGPETGDAGRLAADNAARNLGCLMIEDL